MVMFWLTDSLATQPDPAWWAHNDARVAPKAKQAHLLPLHELALPPGLVTKSPTWHPSALLPSTTPGHVAPFSGLENRMSSVKSPEGLFANIQRVSK